MHPDDVQENLDLAVSQACNLLIACLGKNSMPLMTEHPNMDLWMFCSKDLDGNLEFRVNDGPVGNMGNQRTFDNLRDARKFYWKVREAEGWRHMKW